MHILVILVIIISLLFNYLKYKIKNFQEYLKDQSVHCTFRYTFHFTVGGTVHVVVVVVVVVAAAVVAAAAVVVAALVVIR